jgi:MoaA/NifB/PqqE/SkfB family radical SAM enzyme
MRTSSTQFVMARSDKPHGVLLPIVDQAAPVVRLAHLDDLWFQIAGTLCNLTCRHCFISCSPHNRSFGFLRLAEVERLLQESTRLGVKEYYFTGGEPFLNPDMVPILERTLEFGPATVLTNGTVLKDEWLERLAHAEARSLYSLEFRVSIDGFSAGMNDPIRGEGTFERAMAGVRQLVSFGFLPIITVALTEDDQDEEGLFAGFVQVLKEHGYARPRVKILPTLRLGAEVDRQRGYRQEERVTLEMVRDFDEDRLICNHSRIVTDRGVFVCPILIEAPDARLANSLQDSLGGYALRHHACYTCWQYGNICSNASAGTRDA